MIMKIFNRMMAAAAAILTLGFATGCADDVLEETTSLELSRCLQPMNLKARVNSAYGNRVTFSWDVTKDVENYTLIVYSDSEMTTEVLNKTVAPDNVPYVVDLDPDATYYFKVQALAEGKDDSLWAVYDSSVKTYAVKDNLYLKVSDRQMSSMSLTWSKEVSDYTEVDRIEYAPVDAEEATAYTLSDSDIENATATIDGLTASTEYVFTLYYASASRGSVNIWTLPDNSGLTTVSTDAALLQAVVDGASIYLTMEGSPYTLASTTDIAKGVDVSKGFKMYGEGAADGSRPVVYTCFNITDDFDGGDIYIEGVELNGMEEKLGFVFQHKEGSTKDEVAVNSIIVKNCGIVSFSKGLFYEWTKSMKIGEFTFDSCDIDKINSGGTTGGDGFDLRYTSTITKLQFVNNTITNGFRTFLRNYPQTEGNPAATITELVFNNNTVANLCFVENSNNSGLFGFREVPGSFTMKNNLFLNMVGKSSLAGTSAKNLTLTDMGVTASNNYFYGCVDTFFEGNGTLSMVAGKILSESPCYNAEGGYFNLLADSDIAGEGIGASKWWTAYVEEPLDLRLTDVGAKHTWDFTNAKYFVGDITRSKVADELAMYVVDCPMTVDEGILKFTKASVTTRKGVPTDGFLAFKVSQPGSVVIKPIDGSNNHVVVAVGDVAQNDESTIKSSTVTVKGGASEMANSSSAQKIILSDITGESIVYIYASGAIGLEKLAWSDDVAQVNTALGTPTVSTNPASVTAGEATDIQVTWDAVEYAGSYSVVFSGKTETVSEGCEYTIPAQTVSFLDPGAYKVEVYANPAEGDVYNTPSAAGVGAFAIVPAGGSGDDSEFVVKNLEELNAAIAAGKSEITLASGEYDVGTLVVSAPLALKGQDGAVIKGGVKLSGTAIGSVSFKNIDFQANGSEIFMNLDNSEGVTADDVLVENCVIDGFTKSVIYASNTADKFNISSLTFNGVEIYNQGTGQGMFDLRNGAFSDITITESTLTGGRDWMRIDGNCNVGTIKVTNNTMYNLNSTGNGNGIFFVRANPSEYVVSNNLLLSIAKSVLCKADGNAKIPSMSGNFFYDMVDGFFGGKIDEATATANGGAVLSSSPVKDAANGDFTLTNGVLMSSRTGASKWNPSYETGPSDSFTVTNVEEFEAALGAGKKEITFAASGSPYDLSAANLALTEGLKLSGEVSGGVLPTVKIKQIDISSAVGNVLLENIAFVGDDSNSFINVSSAEASATSITVRNCEISHIKKSVFYDNVGGTVTSVVFSNNVIKDLGAGQGTFDIRKGSYVTATFEQNTIVGGRDTFRADADRVTGALTIANNTFIDCNPGKNGNGMLWVRSTPSSYVVKNNLFAWSGDTAYDGVLAKTGANVSGTLTSNFFYNVADAFFAGAFTREAATANGGVVLSNCPVKDIANGDYTLTDALCLSSNIGAARWNPNAGVVSADFEVSTLDDLITAIAAGKSAITLKSGNYDLTKNTDLSGTLTLTQPLTLIGEKKGGVLPTFVGGIKISGAEMTALVLNNIAFNGKDKSLGTFVEVADENVAASKVVVKGCDISQFNKSLYYDNKGGKVDNVEFSGNTVHDFGSAQDFIDIRKGTYPLLTINGNTFYNGGRTFLRMDANAASKSIALSNNSFYSFQSLTTSNNNGILHVRSEFETLSVTGNIFSTMLIPAGDAYETSKPTLMSTNSDANKPTYMANNHFFNVSEGWFAVNTTTYPDLDFKAEATGNGGSVLDTDPYTDAANANFKTTLAAGDPRWR